MALGIGNAGSSGSGEILNRIEYDARAGRFFRVDRSQNASGDWETNKVEMKTPLTLVYDIENIEVGWVKLDKSGVDFRMVAIGENIGPRPEGTDMNGKPSYRQGFRLKVYSKNLLGGVRTFAHTAQCVIGQMDSLHTRFSTQFPANQGKVPVVTVTDTLPIKSGQSTNYAPVFTIDKWIDRPADLTAPARAEAPKPQAVPSTGSGHAPPPAPKTAEPADMEPEFA